MFSYSINMGRRVVSSNPVGYNVVASNAIPMISATVGTTVWLLRPLLRGPTLSSLESIQ